MEGPHGHIRYKLVALVKIPWMFDLNYALNFTVARYENFNLYPNFRQPYGRELVKTFCSLLCNSKPLVIRIRLPRTVYALSQQIPVIVELINRSSTEVHHTMLSFKRVDSYRTDDGTDKVVKTVIAESRCQGVEAYKELTFGVNFQLPSNLMTSNYMYSKKFRTWYQIRLRVDTGLLRKSPKIYVPITLTTVGSEQWNFFCGKTVLKCIPKNHLYLHRFIIYIIYIFRRY